MKKRFHPKKKGISTYKKFTKAQKVAIEAIQAYKYMIQINNETLKTDNLPEFITDKQIKAQTFGYKKELEKIYNYPYIKQLTDTGVKFKELQPITAPTND